MGFIRFLPQQYFWGQFEKGIGAAYEKLWNLFQNLDSHEIVILSVANNLVFSIS
jgi:hypothetical protein